MIQTALPRRGVLAPRFTAAPSWKAVRDVADRAVGGLQKAFLRAVSTADKGVDWTQVGKLFEYGEQKALEVEGDKWKAVFSSVLQGSYSSLLLKVLVDAGKAELKQAQRQGGFRSAAAAVPPLSPLRFDLINPEAVQWARKEAMTQVRGITSGTQEVLRKLLSQSFSQGIPTDKLARMFREQLSLDPRRQAAVHNFQAYLRTKGKGEAFVIGKQRFRVPAFADKSARDAFIAKQSSRYSDRLLRQRAIAIARTESIAAANEGQRRLWVQAKQKGFLPEMNRVWITTPDDRLCDQCASYNGMVAPIAGQYENGYTGPPAHVGCRCAQGLTRAKVGKVIPPRAFDPLLRDMPRESYFNLPSWSPQSVQRDSKVAAEVFKDCNRAAIRLGNDFGIPIDTGFGSNTSVELAATARGRAIIASTRTALSDLIEGLKILKERGLKTSFGTFGGRPMIRVIMDPLDRVGYAGYKNGVIAYSTGNPVWQSEELILKSLQNDFATGFHPSSRLGGIFTHEYGHLTHHLKAPEMWKEIGFRGPNWILKQSTQTGGFSFQAVARKVSRYATQDGFEFVAETFEGLMSGKTYPKDVMDVYKLLGGPKVPPVVAPVPVAVVPPPVPVPVPVAAPVPPPVVVPVPPPIPVLAPIPAPATPPPIVRVARPIPAGPKGELIQRIIDLRAGGMTYKQVAQEVGWGAEKWGDGKVWEIVRKYAPHLIPPR